MADKVSKQILTWQVQGETQAVQSVGRVQAALNNSKKAAESLHDALTDIRVGAEAQKLGQQYGTLARDILIADDAADELAKSLAEIGASKEDIAAAGREFEKFRTAEADATAAVNSAGSGTSALTQLGAKLRSLPSIRIPGTELGTDAIGNLARVIGTIPPAVYPAIAAIGALAAAAVILNKTSEDNTYSVREVTNRTSEYYKLLVSGTKEAMRAKLEEVQFEQKAAQARVDQLSYVDDAYKETAQQTGVFTGAIIELGGAVGIKQLKDARDAKNAYDEAKTALEKSNNEVKLYTDLLNSNASAVNDAAEAFKKFKADVTDQTIAGVQEQAKVQSDINELIKSGTEKDLEAKKASTLAARDNAEMQIKSYKQILDTIKKGTDEYDRFKKAYDDQIIAYNTANYEFQKLGSSAVEAAVAANDAFTHTKELAKNRAEAVVQYNKDLEKNEEDYNKQKADIQQKYNDALVKAADQAALAAENALNKLNDTAEKLATNLQRSNDAAQRKTQQDSLEAAIKFQQQEAKQARDHANDLLKIQRDAQAREEDLIAARNFSGLFQSRRDTTRQIQEVNEQYQREQQERLLAFQQANDDRARQYAFEAQERQIKYREALQDAQSAYQKDLTAANAALNRANQQAANARNQQLQIAADGYNAQRTLLYNNIRNQLSILSQGYTLAEQKAREYAQALVQSFGLQAGLQGAGVGLGSVSSTSNTRSTSVNNNFNLSGAGVTIQQVANVVSQVLGGFLN